MDWVPITVHPSPVLKFLPALIAGCTPVEANFLNYSQTPAGSTYLWDLGDNTLSHIKNPSHTYTVPGQYTVTLTIETPYGCKRSLTVPKMVTVYGLPEANFSQSANTINMLDPVVSVTDYSIDAVNWEWDFGDASPISYDQNPVHECGDTGSFEIKLLVTSSGGCPDSSYGRLFVEDVFSIYIPNAFTPNGDGVNDSFIAKGVGFTDYDMWIIDRWGKQIFHSTSPSDPWDGSYYHNNNLCQNDVYEYVILVHDNSGKEHKFIGHVTLVR